GSAPPGRVERDLRAQVIGAFLDAAGTCAGGCSVPPHPRMGRGSSVQSERGFRGGRAEARRACAEALLCFVVANIALMGADAYGYILAAGGAPWSSPWTVAQLALLAPVYGGGVAVG